MNRMFGIKTLVVILIVVGAGYFGYEKYKTISVTQSYLYENTYLKIVVPTNWKLTEANRTINNGAVNLTKDDYILYINPQARQASGVDGGRFAEIAMGAPSADMVNIAPPSPACGTSETRAATTNHPRVDLYVSDQDKQMYCNVPTNGEDVWYFSYITNNNGSYFNYYKDGEALSYVITMAYNSKVINNFPVKGSTTLNAMLNEMTGIVKSLVIK